jgi:hypothetical protein
MSDIRKALEALESVLCDPEGKAGIHGSDADMKIIDDALDQLRADLAQPQAAQPEANEEIQELRAQVQAWRKQCDTLTNQVICCGVAAANPDATLTTRGAYAGKWNSPQAEAVRKLRAERDALLANQPIAPTTQANVGLGNSRPKRFLGGRVIGGCSLHDTEKPELCKRHLQSCPEPRTVDCCGVVDEHDIIECSRCGKQWTVPCNFDEDYS